ncbi:MAG: helix-turn-helix transcriptional regulator, partial [Acidobacteriota bacterium]
MGKPAKGARKASQNSAKRGAKRRSQGAVNNYVGRKLRELRLSQGMTCKQVAQGIGISAGSYSGLENGWYRISLDNLFGILKALGAGPEEVWPP